MISRFRPHCPHLALPQRKRVRRQLAISWGVRPELIKPLSSTDELFAEGVREALATKTVKEGDIVVLTAGVPVGISGSTNLIKAQKIG
jgi:pyruvate kinase